MPLHPLFAISISLNTVAENGNNSLFKVFVCLTNSVNLTLLACWVLSPNTNSTTSSPWGVVVVFKVNCGVFSKALWALTKLVINSSSKSHVKS